MRGLFRVAADRMEQPYNEWGAELYAEFPEERLKAVHWARYLIAFHLSFALFAVRGGALQTPCRQPCAPGKYPYPVLRWGGPYRENGKKSSSGYG